jgi:hypothetical protein
MVSIQVLAQARQARDSGPTGLLLRSAACGFALLLASGCSIFQHREAPVAATPAPKAVSAPVDTTPQPTAIEAALARGDTVNSNAPLPVAEDSATQGVVLNPNAPKQYTVKRGDTLWDISAMFLRDPWLWPEIWYVNPAIENPHLIYPGDVLTLAYAANGVPQIRLERGGAQLAGSTRVEPLVRSTWLEGPIPTIPYAAIAAFLGKPTLISREQARRAPHVVTPRDLHVAVGAPAEVYVAGLQGAAPGRYNVVRLGEPMKDPTTHKLLGYMGIYTATARVDTTGKVSKAVLMDSSRETQAGDLLFAEEPQTSHDILPRAAPPNINGQIMSVVDGVTMIGQYQVVAINRGAKQGLAPGHVLAIDEAGEVVHDKSCAQRGQNFCFGGGPKVRLPSERAGTLLVFKTYDDVSYGLTISVTAPVRLADHVRSP